jgi:hypothetical protein
MRSSSACLGSWSAQTSSPELRFGLAQCTRETASGDRKRVVRGGGALSGMLPLAGGSRRRRRSASTLSGRPEAIEAKKIVADVKAAAREHIRDAPDTLKAVMSDAKSAAGGPVSSATAMLARGWGRAKETVDANVGLSLEALILAMRREANLCLRMTPLAGR